MTPEDEARAVATVEPDGRITPIGCTLEEAEAAVAAAAFTDPVPQVGDDELAAWQDFLLETKQRASRIVTS